YMILLAAFEFLLYRYTGQEDIVIGSPSHGRNSARLAPLAGYFVNPVVLRANLAGDPVFTVFLKQVRLTVLGALEHQDYPFPLIVERLQPERDLSHSPLFQVMFILQKAHMLTDAGLEAFALGKGGIHMEVEGLPLD